MPPRLPPLPALRDFIHLYNLRAKKILSQNFLMDMNITRKVRDYFIYFINLKIRLLFKIFDFF